CLRELASRRQPSPRRTSPASPFVARHSQPCSRPLPECGIGGRAWYPAVNPAQTTRRISASQPALCALTRAASCAPTCLRRRFPLPRAQLDRLRTEQRTGKPSVRTLARVKPLLWLFPALRLSRPGSSVCASASPLLRLQGPPQPCWFGCAPAPD